MGDLLAVDLPAEFDTGGSDGLESSPLGPITDHHQADAATG